jgi:hypothetical protein
MKQPKYILAEHKGREWVIRSRNPFIVGEVVDLGAGRISFDLWPQQIVLSLSESQLDDLTASMSRWYHHAKGWPYSQVPDGRS